MLGKYESFSNKNLSVTDKSKKKKKNYVLMSIRVGEKTLSPYDFHIFFVSEKAATKPIQIFKSF
jgi:hypothetical protein